jgi:hypothetical protein
MRFYPLALLAFALVLACGQLADAKVLSKSVVKVTQVRVVHAARDTAVNPTAWGIDSSYIGPGDIRRLLGIDVYLDSYNRIAAVKFTRTTTTGDTVTQLFNDVLELSIETIKPGSEKPSQETPITIHSADGLTFP